MTRHKRAGRCQHLILAVLILFSAQACAQLQLTEADRIANQSSMQVEQVSSEPFVLTTYSRITDISKPVTIYIEGDIRGWWPTVEPGANPMPDDFFGLRMASIDPSPNVVYIARPCQFATSDDTACSPEAWSEGRYAELIITSMYRAVDHFAVPFTHPQINLVGYSGGAAIAAIIATRRHDVTSLRTIAGNLDPAATSRYHAAEVDEDYTDPMLVAQRLRLLPQIHYVGDRDAVVPPFLAGNFIKAEGPSYCITLTDVQGATHTVGWEKVWRDVAAKVPTSCGHIHYAPSF